MGKESTRVVKAIIESHPRKELVKEYLKQYQDLYGDDLYIKVTKKDFLVIGLLKFFALIKRR